MGLPALNLLNHISTDYWNSFLFVYSLHMFSNIGKSTILRSVVIAP